MTRPLHAISPRLLFSLFLLLSIVRVEADVTLERTVQAPPGEQLFSYVSGLSADEEGRLYAADSILGRVNHTVDEAWRILPTPKGDDGFKSPFLEGVAVLDQGRLAVSDSLTGTIAILNRDDGKIERFFASKGRAKGELDQPKGLFFSANRRLYVAEQAAARVSVFGPDGIFLQTLGDSQALESDNRLSSPEQVVVDLQERVFVFQGSGNGEVLIYSHDGYFLRRITAEEIAAIVHNDQVKLSAIALDRQGHLYLGDNRNGRVYQLDWQQGVLLNSFGSKGSLRGQFGNITALVALADGRLAVADSNNKKIEIFHLSTPESLYTNDARIATIEELTPTFFRCEFGYQMKGEELLCVGDKDGQSYRLGSRGERTLFEGELKKPTGVAISDEDIAILDNNRLLLYRHDGKLRFSIGQAGRQDGAFNNPQGVALQGDFIYVADSGNSRLQIFSRDGVFISKIDSSRFQGRRMKKPTALVLDTQGRLFVADEASGEILVFEARSREFLYALGGGGGRSDPHFERFYDLAVDEDENLYVLAGTEDNGYTIRLFQGPRQVFAFGAAGRLNSAFKQARNLTLYPSQKSEIGVYDSEWGRLFRFAYHQVPPKVGGLFIRGQQQGSHLRWQEVPGSFINYYRVYGAESKNGPFRLIHEAEQNSAYIEHKGQGFRYYEVAAVSDYGREGFASTPRQDLFHAGYRAYQQHNYADAVHFFGRARRLYNRDPETLRYLGLSLLEVGRAREAGRLFAELSELKDSRVMGRRLRLRALFQEGEYLDAKRAADALIADKLADESSYLLCAKVSLKLEDGIGAVNCLEQLIAAEGDHAEAHFLMGQAYVKLGLVDRALSEFDRAAQLESGDSDVRYRSALVLQELGKHQQAIHHLQEALELEEKSPKIQIALAESLLVLKQYDKVRNIALSLSTQEGYLSHGQYLLGVIAVSKEDFEEALLAFNKATYADAGNTEAWLALADVYLRLDQPTRVLPVLQKAVEADPKSFQAAWRLGLHALELERYPLAVESLTKAATLQADHPQVRYQLAMALYRAGHLNQGLANALEAHRLLPKSVEALHLLAKITQQQGKSGEAIDYMKQALALQPNDATLQVDLAEFYIAANLYELAEPLLERAALLAPSSSRPQRVLGSMLNQRRLFDRSIAALDRAVAIEPTAENKRLLESVYANKKQSMQFKSNAPQVVLEDLRLNRLFSAAYKQYANESIGSIRLRNTSGTRYGNLKLSFEIKGYMDFPWVEEIRELQANSTLDVQLRASFNNRVLEIDEDTGVQVEVKLLFVRDGREDSINLTQPMTLYGKNAILWGDSQMVGSFVTPKDEILHNFVRQLINRYRPDPEPLNANLVTAMTLFDAFSSYGIKYVQDPNSPYSKMQRDQVDYVQFARETLRLRSGDCDDLSVLLSAALENLGIKVALLDVPGHLLLMFDTGLPQAQREQISLQDELLAIYEGQVWIPLEATMLSTSFSEAWTEGASKYQRYSASSELKVIPLHEAWQSYQPVTLKPATFELELPDEELLKARVQSERRLLLEKSLQRVLKPYEALLASNPDERRAAMQIAILYARYGLYDEAHQAFEALIEEDRSNSSAYNNRGNLYFIQQDYERALESYSYAERLAANDPLIKINMAMAYFRLQDLRQARSKFDEAVTIRAEVADQFAAFSKLLQ